MELNLGGEERKVPEVEEGGGEEEKTDGVEGDEEGGEGTSTRF
jgi:hypothetical protein